MLTLLRNLLRQTTRLMIMPCVIIVGLTSLAPASTNVENPQIGCLALNIYHEARGESPQGQQAVAAVTLNRVQSQKFPSSICTVVWQPKQFSWTHTQKNYFPYESDAWKSALKIANSAISREVDVAYQNIFYYHSKTVSPYWSKSKRFVARVGDHLFYSS